MNRSLCSWSGGKDSYFALWQAMQQGYAPAVLLNVMNETGVRSRSHGIPATILEAQAASAGLPLQLISSSWADYEKNFVQSLTSLRHQYDLSHAIFGDIDLQAHRDWEEMVCARAGLEAVLPLWQQDRLKLVQAMLEAGIETMIVSCNEQMGAGFLGRYLTNEMVDELQPMGIDACGENGEFHTLVTNGPLFKKRIYVTVSNRLRHENYWFCEMQLDEYA